MTLEATTVRVVLVVFDGLRPDRLSPDRTPHLLRLAARGTRFGEARSVFPPVTRVATTSIATGAPPAVHGVVNNAFLFEPAFANRILDTSRRIDLMQAEAVSAAGFVALPTFGDVLAQAGRSVAIVHTGTPGAAHLLHPRAAACGHWVFSIHGPEASGTPEASREMVARFGSLPPRALPRFADIDYATRVITEHVLPVMKPDVTVFWLNEPDTTFHDRGIGSDEADAVIRHADAAFGRILDAIAAGPDADRTAVIALSDHGHVTVEAVSSLIEEAVADGFRVGRGADLHGADLAITGGRSGEVRLLSDDPRPIRAFAGWLAARPDVSHLFGREDRVLEPLLPLDAVSLDHPRAADLFYVLGHTAEHDRYGLPGTAAATAGGGVSLGGGQHGGLSPEELVITCVAAGPGFLRGAVDAAHVGLVDIAPTILSCFGLPTPPTMVGRDLAGPAHDLSVFQTISAPLGSRAQSVRVADAGRRRFVLGG